MTRKKLAVCLTLLGLASTSCGGYYVEGEYPPPEGGVIAEEPPPPLDEEQPPEPWEGAVWAAGYWRWTGERYIWVRGTWVRPPRVGLVWHVGGYARRGHGFVWVEGRWAPPEWEPPVVYIHPRPEPWRPLHPRRGHGYDPDRPGRHRHGRERPWMTDRDEPPPPHRGRNVAPPGPEPEPPHRGRYAPSGPGPEPPHRGRNVAPPGPEPEPPGPGRHGRFGGQPQGEEPRPRPGFHRGPTPEERPGPRGPMPGPGEGGPRGRRAAPPGPE